jgi:hypothetical protein
MRCDADGPHRYRNARDATVLAGSDVALASMGKEHSAGRSAALPLLVHLDSERRNRLVASALPNESGRLKAGRSGVLTTGSVSRRRGGAATRG